MQVGDLYRCARMLNIHLRIDTPSPECIERRIVYVVVQAMRVRRRNGSTNGWPDLGQDEAEKIRRLARTLGYIDDGPARDATRWQPWLSLQAKRFQSIEPRSDSTSCLLKAVGLGDWLATQQYLPLFDSLLYSDIRALQQFADDRNDCQLKEFIERFIGRLAEALDMLYLFRSTTNGTVEEVDRKRSWCPGTAEFRLAWLELTADDFRGENEVLGRLIVRSRVLRSLFEQFLFHRQQSIGSADTHRERREQ
jgi:hypothetical protein